MRAVIAGLAGGITMNLAMLLTFRAIGFGWNGHGILLTSPLHSKKLIAVWTQLEPLPLVVANPVPIAVGILLFGIGHAFYLQVALNCVAIGNCTTCLEASGPAFLHDVFLLGVFHAI